MTREFNIYPALFILTPVRQEVTISTNARIEKGANWPSTFWGDCLFNESHSQLVLRFNADAQDCPFEELSNQNRTVLKPAKFKGERYTITYIPVLN